MEKDSDMQPNSMVFMMLMGIRTGVGKFANEPSRDLVATDFEQRWDGDFLSKGSAETPAHGNSDFRFRDYSPIVFRHIRERFGVMTQDYLLSLTSEYVLVEMFTNSKSGSFFFYSADHRFILKTCTRREAAFLVAALPLYYSHLMAHRYTLLCRFFGLHRVHLPTALSKKVYFVVMGNVFPIDKPIHERYDLKGSTRGRITTEAEREDPNVVLKDLDWIRAGRKLHLGADKRRRLLTQITKDCALLERLEVIDYSLLVGIHRASLSRHPSLEREGSRFFKVTTGSRSPTLGASTSREHGTAAADENSAGATTIGDRLVGSAGGGRVDAPGHHGKLLAPMPAHRGRADLAELCTNTNDPDEPEVGKEIYFVGCIDILCDYGLKKQLEHHYKAAKHGEKVGAQNFSVVDPVQYSTRFQNFVADALS